MPICGIVVGPYLYRATQAATGCPEHEARSPELHAGPRLLLAYVNHFSAEMIDEKQRLLEQAERCRRIAQSTCDPETVAMLLCLARSYEAKAAQLIEPHSRR
jgi:hypothetical protein